MNIALEIHKLLTQTDQGFFVLFYFLLQKGILDEVCGDKGSNPSEAAKHTNYQGWRDGSVRKVLTALPEVLSQFLAPHMMVHN